ncbi:MAG: hypothetical protein CMO66_03335 [Verrucomicrobiales bacterium]|nr:hypothetical protein [Verrucomicrobiales bacterium]
MKKVVLPILALACVGCITVVGAFVWEKRSGTTALVFGDDDAWILGADFSHEISMNSDPPFIPGRVRNNEFQLYMQQRDGSGRREVGRRQAGSVETAYLMKRAGYVLSQIRTDSHIQFSRMGLKNGGVQLVYEVPWYHRSLPFVRVIPSPDGKVLARCQLSRRSWPREAGLIIPRKIAEIEVVFLDSESLEVTGRGNTIMFAEGAASLEVVWQRDKTLLLTCFSEKEARVMTLDGKSKPIAFPERLSTVQTTSSQWDGNGRWLEGFAADGMLILGDPKPEKVFGAN